MRPPPLLLTIGILLLFSGCASLGLGSAEKTNQMRHGMSYDEVVALLGEPSSAMQDGKWVVRWNFHEMWKGVVPFDVSFYPESRTLMAWAANGADYQRSQQALAQMAGAVAHPQGDVAAPGYAQGTDPASMQQMAGEYYSFSSAGLSYSGGTKMRVLLCADGRYCRQSDSSCSAGAGTAGACATDSQGGATGTWTVQGNYQQGTLVTRTAAGSETVYGYSRCGDDCINMGNTKFAFTPSTTCP